YNVSRKIAKLRGYILENHTFSSSGLSTVTLTKQILDIHGVDPTDTGKVVGTLGDINGIKVWVFFIEEPDLIRVRIRSKGPVINTIAQKYNGGGHPLAAGASVHSWEEAQRLIDDLEHLCRND